MQKMRRRLYVVPDYLVSMGLEGITRITYESRLLCKREVPSTSKSAYRIDIRRTYLSETHKITQQLESEVRWYGESAHTRHTVGSIPTRLFSMLMHTEPESGSSFLNTRSVDMRE